MSNIVLRPAAESDLGAITAIYAEAVRNGFASYELEPPTRAEMGERFASLRRDGFPYVVAEDAGGIVGYAYLGPFRTRPAYRFIVEDSIYLSPNAQGRGTGRLLLERLIEQARSFGFRQIIAVIGDGSPRSASVRLHEKLGFAHSGVLRASGYKHGRWLDTIFMQLALNGGGDIPPDPASLPERRFRGEI